MSGRQGQSESFSVFGANIFGSPRGPNGRGSGLKLRTVWVQIPPGARRHSGGEYERFRARIRHQFA